MPLSIKQSGVRKGAAAGAIIAVMALILAVLFNPLAYPESLSASARFAIACKSSLVPALFLAISIGRLANHRFFSPEDIDGAGLTNGSETARQLQAVLQNTLEQTVLAVIMYMAWTNLMPSAWQSVPPVAALCFGVGRILFFIGYHKGAPSRALGFAMTCYPSLVMLACVIAAFLLDIARNF